VGGTVARIVPTLACAEMSYKCQLYVKSQSWHDSCHPATGKTFTLLFLHQLFLCVSEKETLTQEVTMGYRLKNGKLLEWFAQQEIIERGGFAAGQSGRGREFVGSVYGSVGMDLTNETGAKANYLVVGLDGAEHRLGRGERFGDAIVNTPVEGNTFLDLSFVSLKGGDSRDLTTDVELAKRIVEAGLPLWVWTLDGDCPDAGAEIEKGIAFHLTAAPTEIKVRRINVTPLLRDMMGEDDWQMGPREGRTCFVRVNKVGKYTYPRLRVVWKSVPSRYWLDEAPIPLSEAFAPITVKECIERAHAHSV